MKREILERIDSVVAGYVNQYASDWTEIDRPRVEKCDDSIPFMVMMRPSGVDVAFFGGDYLNKENALHSRAAVSYHELFLYYDGNEMQSVTKNAAQELCDKASARFEEVELSMDGFNKALDRYEENIDFSFDSGRVCGICGPWSLESDAANHMIFNVSYEGKLIVSASKDLMRFDEYEDGRFALKRELNISDKDFSEIVASIQGRFSSFAMEASEQEKVFKNLGHLGR